MDIEKKESVSQIPDYGFTHGAKFHSDDVFSTALLRILNPDIQIERGFLPPEDYQGIVYDVGRGAFDHHQEEKEFRENGVPYAAFGLLWRAFGTLIMDSEDAEKFDQEFVQPLDLSDNTGSECQLAYIISEFNPVWDGEQDYDVRFWRAVDFAIPILTNHFQRVAGSKRATDVVRKAMDENDGTILVLSQYVPWNHVVIGSSYVYVIYPSSRGGYSIQGVPLEHKNPKLVLPFPKDWCGKTPKELEDMTQIPTFRFCHANAFLCAADTLEDAHKIARLSLEQRNN